MSITLQDLLPTIGIIVASLLGLGTYAWQERIKHRTALAERKQTIYEELIRNLVELLVAKTGNERSKLISEVEKGWLFASDDVLRACYDYLTIYDNLSQPTRQDKTSDFENVLAQIQLNLALRQKMGKSLAAIFLAMRRDIRQDTKISDEWAKQHLQIYTWGIIAKEDLSPDPIETE